MSLDTRTNAVIAAANTSEWNADTARAFITHGGLTVNDIKRWAELLDEHAALLRAVVAERNEAIRDCEVLRLALLEAQGYPKNEVGRTSGPRKPIIR